MADDKVIEIEERIPSLKERRRRNSTRRFISYLTLFLILIGAAIYFQSSFSKVQQVIVEGNQFVDSDWVITNSGLLEDVSMWSIDEDEVINKIETNRKVKEVTIERKWMNTVILTLEENYVVAHLVENDQLIPVLENGVLLRNVDQQTALNGPILQQFEEEQVIEKIANELDRMNSSIQMRISEIFYEPVDGDPERLILLMNDGFTVHSTLTNFADRMEGYTSIVDELDPDIEGIVHLKVSPYFEAFEEVEDDEEMVGNNDEVDEED